ncbi:MAG: FUSC family protein [Burkholderiaceae bacterium]
MNRLDFVLALGSAVVVALSFAGGLLLAQLFPHASGFEGALWAGVSGVVVLQATREKTESAAQLRVVGTLIGAILSGIYLSVASFSVLGLALCVFVTVLVCQRIGVPDNARLASATVVVVMALSVLHPDMPAFINAGLRFAESVIGAACAVLWSLIGRRLRGQ